MTLHLIAQIVGFIAYGLSAVALLHRKDRHYLNYTIASQCIWVVHYSLLNAINGTMGMAISLGRSVGARFITEPRFKIILLVILLTAYGVTAFLKMKEFADLLPYIGSAVGSIGVLLSQGIKMRLSILFSSLCWITYSIIVGSIPGIVQEVTMISFNLFTMYHLQKLSRAEALTIVS